MSHAFVIGGTGMLADVCLYLASRGMTVSVVARGEKRLVELARKADMLTGTIFPMKVDYHDWEALRAQIQKAVRICGQIDLLVLLVHHTAPEIPYLVTQEVRSTEKQCRVFHILGSMIEDPAKQNIGMRNRFAQMENIQYYEVILGYIKEEGKTRWLTNEEIRRGIIQTIDKEIPRTIVGTVSPWTKHPPPVNA